MAPSIDMFRLLPASLLSVIVSLLPFKEAVRTSILSRRWLDISKTTTNIEFDELFFVKSDQPDQETKEAKRRAFLDFVTFWIDNHPDTVIDKLSLRLAMPGKAREVIEKCMAFASQYGVKELELDFSLPHWNHDHLYYVREALFELPRHVYGNICLKYLKLYSCSFVIDLFTFQSLREVSLGWMEVRITDVKTLLSNCKMLESISLKRCWSSDEFDLGEENLRLTKLVVDMCDFNFDLFKINAPNLKFFHYSGLMTFFVVDVRTFIVEEVDLNFSFEYGFEGHGLFLYHLLEDLRSVKVLTVCSYLLQVIPCGGHPLRMQHPMNVRHLIIKAALHLNEFLGITYLISSCPNLERLTIEICPPKALLGYEPPSNFDPEGFWIDNAEHYRCMGSTLKEVEIKGFRGTQKEIRVLNYLIICGNVLKKIDIHVMKGDFTCDHARHVESLRRDAAEMLLDVPRASDELEISIY